MDIGHHPRDADLVPVEVVGLLAAFIDFVDPVVYLRQRLVEIRSGIDLGIPAVRVDFLQQTIAVPSEASLVFEVV